MRLNGRIDFNIGQWNFWGLPKIRFQAEAGSHPTIKLYCMTGTDPTVDAESYPWWIECSGDNNIDRLDFKGGCMAKIGEDTTQKSILSLKIDGNTAPTTKAMSA